MRIFDTYLFACNEGSKVSKAADFYSGDFYQQSNEILKILLNVGKNL